MGTVCGPTPGKFMHVGMADDDRAGRFEPSRHGSVTGGDVVAADLTGGGGAEAFQIDVVFERDGNSMQGPQRKAGGLQRREPLGRLARSLLVDGDIGVVGRLLFVQALQIGVQQLRRRNGEMFDLVPRLYQ